MSEQIAFQPNQIALPAAEQARSLIDMQTQVDILSAKFPGVEELREPGLVNAANEIVADFAIKPEFFEGKDAEARSLIFNSLAYRYSKLEGNHASVQNMREKEFIANSVFVLAKKYTDASPDLVKQMDQEAGHATSDGNGARVIDKFTQHELTKDLAEMVKNQSLLADTKRKLGITDENEDPYELHVLSIKDDGGDYGIGRQPLPWPSMDDWKNDRAGAIKRSNEIDDEYFAAKQWAEGLDRRAKEYALEYGTNVVPGAFITESDNRKFLCVTAPYAEKIAYNEDSANRKPDYTERDQEDDQALLFHEYTHTQGGLSTEGVFFGINLEERRAEYFSGDKHGYQDIKAFFADMRIATGFDTLDYFNTHVKGGKKEEIYAAIAENVGLGLLPEVLMAVPRNYLNDQAGSINREIDEFIGSYSGVIGRLIEFIQKKPGGQSGIDERLEESAQGLARTNIEDFSFVRSYRKNLGSVHFTDKIFDRAEQIRAEQVSSGTAQ